MTTKQKFIFGGIVTVLILLFTLSGAILVKLYWDKYKINQVTEQLNEELMASNLELGKAKTEFANAELKKLHLERELRRQINKYNEKITDYGELQVKYEYLEKEKGKTKIVYVDREILVAPEGYSPGLYQIDTKTARQIDKLEGSYSDYHLEGTCRFTPVPNKTDIPMEFEYKLTLNFEGQIVKTLTKTGAVNYYFNLWEINDRGERLKKLQLTKFDMLVNKPNKKSFFFAPHIDFQLIGGLGLRARTPTIDDFHTQLGLGFGVSLFGYGLTKDDLTWRFAGISIDGTYDLGNQWLRPGIGFSPVSYNLGKIVPLISNLWIGPHISINIKGQWWLGLSIGAML